MTATNQNLLGEPPDTLLPENPEARRALDDGTPPVEVAARFPAYSLAWALLGERAFESAEPIKAYACARTGYHRGLDQLRHAGWQGHGPIPWRHEPNRGFLRCLHLLARTAAAIGETDEARRCRQFLADSDPEAVDALS